MSSETVRLQRRSPVRRWRTVIVHFGSGLHIHGLDWLLEVVILNAAFALAFVVRYGGRVPPQYIGIRSLLGAAMVAAAYSASVLVYRSYRIVWQFASVRDMLQLALTVGTTVVVIGVVELGPLRSDRPIPLSALLIGGSLGYLALGHLKMISRLRAAVPQREWGEPLLIFGAGAGGVTLAQQLRAERGRYRPVAFLDDDHRKIGRDVGGLRVLGSREDIAVAMRRSGARSLAIAVPSMPADRIRALSRVGSVAGARVLVVPSIQELLTGKRSKFTLRDVDMEDLVGRMEVAVDMDALRGAFEGKRVLVTGAAGSIGSELVRQLRSLDPASVTMLDNNETGLVDLLDALGPIGAPLRLCIGTVHDEATVRRVFSDARPHVVIHAAALKHVDLLEQQPHEAVRVNVLGTWVCINAAEAVGAETFVLISSDKAVDPVGVLGASKRLGELMVAGLRESSTLFTAVRFGNVIGSRGSVLPRFEQQITQGGPLTVTHPDVHRFFMSVDEAVRLVLQCSVMARQGCIYVLDMGDDVSIVELATRLAHLHGLRVPDDIEMIFTGMRPGERLREALVSSTECPSATRHPKVREIPMLAGNDREQIAALVADLRPLAAGGSTEQVRRMLVDAATRVPSSAQDIVRVPG